MKILAMILLFICIPALAIGAPFLTCDVPTDSPGYAKIFEDGVEIEANHTLRADDTIMFDLVGRPVGEHTYTAEYCNIRGCSAASNPTLLPAIPQSPLNLLVKP